MSTRDARFDSKTLSQHVGLKGHSSNNVFLDDSDRAHFLESMGSACEEYDVNLLVYALMDNHVHMILHGDIDQFQFVFESIGATYAREFNQKAGGSGAVWTQRFYAGPIQSQDQFLKTAAYIFHNPVDAGLCKNPQDYDWSNLSDLIEGEGGTAWKIIDELVNVENLVDYTLSASKWKLTNRESMELGLTEEKRVLDSDLYHIVNKHVGVEQMRKVARMSEDIQMSL